jgi:iron complex transport system ATP-binding protein
MRQQAVLTYSPKHAYLNNSTITQLENGPTLLYITHHPDEITPDFQKVMLLRQGQIVRSGTPLGSNRNRPERLQMPVTVNIVNNSYFVLQKNPDTFRIF